MWRRFGTVTLAGLLLSGCFGDDDDSEATEIERPDLAPGEVARLWGEEKPSEYSYRRYEQLTVAGDGTVYVVADSGSGGSVEELPVDGEVRDWPLEGVTNPDHVAFAPDGVSYVVETAGYEITRHEPDGGSGHVAGTGKAGPAADSGTAEEVAIGDPSGLAYDPRSKSLYVAEGARIRRVTGERTIEVVAGAGESGFSGDGGPATDALLTAYSLRRSETRAMTVDPRTGDLYFVDLHRVRRVNKDGLIDTVAGSGQSGFSGDGGSATEARLNGVNGLAVDPGNGDLYMADNGNHRVRRVERRTNEIATVLGNGVRRDAGDGGPITKATVADMSGIGVDGRGWVYVLTRGNGSRSTGIVRVFLPRPSATRRSSE